MIITLVVIGVVIVGIILMFISKNRNIGWSAREAAEFIGILMIITGIFACIMVTAFATSNAINYELDYQNFLHEKEVLEYRIEHMEDNVTGNEMLYNDIVEFNNELRSEKKWANNPWTNWFNNQDIAAMDYIELDAH